VSVPCVGAGAGSDAGVWPSAGPTAPNVNLPVNAPAAAAPTVNPPVNAAPPFKSSSLRLARFEPIGVSFEPIGLSLEKWHYGAITSPRTKAYAALPNPTSAHEQGCP
jgi:hypothetical protein